jgi:hypothetical protein
MAKLFMDDALGKNANSQNAVSISLANRAASIPVAFQLYLPEKMTMALRIAMSFPVTKRVGAGC